MKNLVFSILAVICCLNALAQSTPCNRQDTSRVYRVRTTQPYAIALSKNNRVAVTSLDTVFGRRDTVKVWKRLYCFTNNLRPDYTFNLTGPGGVVFDSSGNLYVVQMERADSNIMIYDTGMHLVRVIDNSPSTAVAWFHPRGITIDSAQNIYIISDDTLNGKLIKITNPLTSPSKSLLLSGLLDPRGVAFDSNNVYVAEYRKNQVNWYNLGSMAKVDSITIRKPADLFTTGCKLYCTEQDSGTVRVLTAHHLTGGFTDTVGHFGRKNSPDGVMLSAKQELFICDRERNKVVFYRSHHTAAGSSGGSCTNCLPMCIHTHTTVTGDVLLDSWRSTDTSVATVDSTGSVYSANAGSCLIIHHYTTHTDTFYCSVSLPLASGIAGSVFTISDTGLIYGSTRICLENALQLLDTSAPGWGYWSTSNSGIADIDYDGVVWPQDTGTVTLSYNFTNVCGTRSAAFVLNIVGEPEARITGPDTVCLGSTATLTTADLSHSGQWTSSDTAIATVDNSGHVYGRAVGSALITYSVANCCDRVTSIHPVTVMRLPNAGTIFAYAWTCTGATSYATSSVSGGLWSTSSASIATIDMYGVITGISEGIALIIYTDSNYCGVAAASRTIDVYRIPTLYFTGPSAICIPATVLYTGNVVPGPISTYATLTWALTNTVRATSTYSYTGGSYTALDSIKALRPGADTLIFTATNLCGTTTEYYPIAINAAPDTGTISGPRLLCLGSTAHYVTSGSGAWSWGHSFPTRDSIAVSGVACDVTALGTGTDTLTFTSISASCGFGTTSYVFTIVDTPYARAIIGPFIACVGSTVMMTDSTHSGVWRVTGGHSHISSAGSVAAVTAGVDTIKYVDSNYCGVSIATHALTIYNIVVPSDSIVASSDTLCGGDTVSLHVLSVNGGATPFYQWQVSGVNTDTGSTYTYTPVVGDRVTCIMNSSAHCAAPDTVTSNSITMMVSPSVTPTVSIISSVGDSISYLGQIVTFYATATYGGSPTLYQWYENGTPVSGATSSSFATTLYATNDTVYCIITSNAPCATATTATSGTTIVHGAYLGIPGMSAVQGNYSLYPNPTHGNFTLTGSSAENEAVTICICNATGVVVWKGTATPKNGNITQVIELPNALPPGVYQVKLVGKNAVTVLPLVRE